MRVGIAYVFVVAACGGGESSGDCSDGEERPCYQGTADTREVGACHDGIERCSAGRWTGSCLGDVTPFVERCNGADDDCNGTVDDVETAGEPCNGADGCVGMRGCSNGVVACLSPGKNECGVCGGDAVSGLGTTCANEVCTGALVCSSDGESAICNAPQQNACELCGGPVISGLGDACVASSGCDGARVCNASGTSTTCSCNPFPGQCKESDGTLRAAVAPLVGDLVITEVMPSPTAVDDPVGEWFEVRVTRDVDLNQVALDRAGDTATPVVIESANCLRVTAGTNLLFARSADPLVNGGLPAVTARFTFPLVPGSTTTPADVRLLYEGAVLDSITWTSSTAGKSRQLDPDLLDVLSNDSPSNFCDGSTPYGTGTPQDLGTPGADNVQCGALPPAGSCLDGGSSRAIVKPAAGQLVITEYLADPQNTDTLREWVEIANVGATSFDLNGLTLGRATGSGTPVSSAACIPIAPSGFGLWARSANPSVNGGLAVDATFSFSIVNSGSVASPADLEVRDGTTVLDSVVYTTSMTAGAARQLDPDSFTASGNTDASGTSWCNATAAYGDNTPQDRGTPRAPNRQCP